MSAARQHDTVLLAQISLVLVVAARQLDVVEVHARLSVVVLSDESPVAPHARKVDELGLVLGCPSDKEVLDCGCVEHLDVGDFEHLTENNGHELSDMLDNHVVALVFVWNVKLVEEQIYWLTHDHGREQLASQPASSSWSNVGLDDDYLLVTSVLGNDIGGG